MLTLQVPRPDRPALSAVNAAPASLPAAAPPNDLQRSLVAGTARRLNMDGKQTLDGIKTRQQAIDFFAQRPEDGPSLAPFMNLYTADKLR